MMDEIQELKDDLAWRMLREIWHMEKRKELEDDLACRDEEIRWLHQWLDENRKAKQELAGDRAHQAHVIQKQAHEMWELELKIVGMNLHIEKLKENIEDVTTKYKYDVELAERYRTWYTGHIDDLERYIKELEHKVEYMPSTDELESYIKELEHKVEYMEDMIEKWPEIMPSTEELEAVILEKVAEIEQKDEVIERLKENIKAQNRRVEYMEGMIEKWPYEDILTTTEDLEAVILEKVAEIEQKDEVIERMSEEIKHMASYIWNLICDE